MKFDKHIDCIIVISCIMAIVIALSLTPAPRDNLTQAWISDYPKTSAIGRPVDFNLHITGELTYIVDIFVDKNKNTTVVAKGGDTLGFSIEDLALGKHRIHAEITDLTFHDTHELFFTVDIV